MSMPTVDYPPPVDKRHKNTGRPRKIDARLERNVSRSIRSLRVSNGLSFSADEIRGESRIEDVNRSTMTRCLHRLGFRKRHLRKKGILTDKDRRLRVQFARKQLREREPDFWKNKVCMYLDGVSFVHKTSPFFTARNHHAVGYLKRGEGLKITAKGAKEGVNGKTVPFYVGITYGQGVVFCKQFLPLKCNGATYSAWIEKEFPPVFRRVNKGRSFVQDGDPVQNSALVKKSYTKMEAEVIAIPARSPDLNPVENVFNNVRRELRREALEKRIVRESYGAFCERVKRKLRNFSPAIIDSSIANMESRLRQIIDGHGYRTKY